MGFNKIIVVIFSLFVCTFGQKAISAEKSDNDIQPRCENKETSDICLGCSRLPPVVQVPSDLCCSDSHSFMFCDACLRSPESCDKLVKELEQLALVESEDEYYDDVSNGDSEEFYDDSLQALFGGAGEEGGAEENIRSKRFGRLFVKAPKRYGRLIFGKRDMPIDSELQKRFGRLYMGSGGYFGKRGGATDTGNDVEKRYGPLFMNNKNGWFGKRNGDAEPVIDKRYGPLFMGKSRNGWFGKRSGETDVTGDDYDVSKRYGPLFMGKGSYFGKRSEPITANKRYGRLFMGRRRGSWLG